MNSLINISTKPVIIAGGGSTGIFTLLELVEKGRSVDLYEGSSILGGAPAISGANSLSNRPASFNWGPYKEKVERFFREYYPSIDIDRHYAPRDVLFQEMLTSFIPPETFQNNVYLNSTVRGVRLKEGDLVVTTKDGEGQASSLIIATGHAWNTPVHEGFESVLGGAYYSNPWLSSEEINHLKPNSRILLLGGANGAVDFAKHVKDLGRNDVQLTMATADGAGFRPLTMNNLFVDMAQVKARLSEVSNPREIVNIFQTACEGGYGHNGEEVNINPFIVTFSKAVKEYCSTAELKGLSNRFVKMAGRIISPDVMKEMEDMGRDSQLKQVRAYVTSEDVYVSDGNVHVLTLGSDLSDECLDTLDTLDPKIFRTDIRSDFDYVVHTSPFVRGLLVDQSGLPIDPLMRSAVENNLIGITEKGQVQSLDERVIVANPSLNPDNLFSVARSIEEAQRVAAQVVELPQFNR